MQAGTGSQGTTQAGTGEAAPLLPIQDGFWIWGEGGERCHRLAGAHKGFSLPPNDPSPLRSPSL